MNAFSLPLNNRFTQLLPADPQTTNETRQVYNACYSFVNPTPVSQPKVLAVSEDLMERLGFEHGDEKQDWFRDIFTGNTLIEKSQPYAMCYGGHQFGHWAGQLGDGRAINLAEIIDTQNQNQTLQLKGAGLTPYSRTADGLAVLRSSIREFLCSEAMFHLGVPTTRALSLSLTGEKVLRDMMYDGHPEYEPGAIVCRVAPSFLRFGSFQIFAARKDYENLKRLMDYCIQYDYPHLGEPNIDVYEQWFDEICRKTCEMIVHWMRVGFVHGVMNTDNMSILGLTIDYGPYGWIDNYDPHWTPNTTDAEGKRYSFGNQPQIAQWNLLQLANTLYTVIGRSESLERSLESFANLYTASSQTMWIQKLGLDTHNGESDTELVRELFDCFSLTEVDMTIFFRELAKFESTHTLKEGMTIVQKAFYELDNMSQAAREKFEQWLSKYAKRILLNQIDDAERKTLMNQTNPKYVLRNYLAQIAIDKATSGDYSEIENLLNMIKNPYKEQPNFEHYYLKRPDWAKSKVGCSMLSCSS